MPTPGQKAIIHTLVSKLKITDEDYRSMLDSFGVKSSKDLTFAKATELIKVLVKMADGKDVYMPSGQPKRFQNLKNRDNDMARPEQLRMIEAMWCEVSYMTTLEEKREALKKFLKNKWKIDRLEWLPRSYVCRVVKTIQAMKGAKKSA